MKFDFSNLEISVFDIQKKIYFPSELSVELAELIGILVGDGHLSVLKRIGPTGKIFTQSTVFVSGNSNEKEYLEYIQNLFLTLFNTHLTYRIDKRSEGVLLLCYSKGLVDYLNKVCQIPIGRKCATVRVPKIIFDSSNQMKKAFLRGLADTDFSLCFKNKSKKGYAYPVIKGSFRSKQLINDLEKLSLQFGFIYCTCYNLLQFDSRFSKPTLMHAIYLNGVKNLELWMKLIGFSHPKHNQNYQEWLLTGQCVPKKEEKRAPGES